MHFIEVVRQFSAPLFTVSLPVVAFSLVLWATRSLHPLRTRIWQLVMGRAVTPSQEITSLIEARNELTRFKYFFGISVRTAQRGIEIARWAKDNDEDPSDIRACGDLFDLEKPDLRDRVPSSACAAGRAAVALCASVAFTLPWSLSAFGSQVLVEHKRTGELFWIAPEAAQSLWGRRVITASECESGATRGTWGDSQFQGEICQSLKDPETKKRLQPDIVLQRVMLLAITIAFAPALYFLFVWGSTAFAARRMHARLELTRSRLKSSDAETAVRAR